MYFLCMYSHCITFNDLSFCFIMRLYQEGKEKTPFFQAFFIIIQCYAVWALQCTNQTWNITGRDRTRHFIEDLPHIFARQCCIWPIDRAIIDHYFVKDNEETVSAKKRDAGLKPTQTKYSLFQKKIKYLCHVVSAVTNIFLLQVLRRHNRKNVFVDKTCQRLNIHTFDHFLFYLWEKEVPPPAPANWRWTHSSVWNMYHLKRIREYWK